MFYIFDGDDDFSRDEALAALKAQLGPADIVSLNTSVFDGASVSLDELRHACDSVPFFGNARLVIVNGLLTRLHAPARKKAGAAEQGEGEDTDEPAGGAHKEYRTRLLEYLPMLPATTHLVFLESALLPSKSPFVALLDQHPDKGRRQVFSLPNPRSRDGQGELAAWIRTRAKAKGARIDAQAVDALLDLIGNDLRLLDSELEKLAAYCGENSITLADVRQLVPLAREAVVWDLIDAIAQKRLGPALDTLRRLLNEGEPALRIFGLMVSEYRLLLQARTLADQGYTEDRIATRLKVHPWRLHQRMDAARRGSTESLKATYRLLLQTDTEIKTGVQEPEAALEFLVASLCR
ncbi:MAG: DNA polymerase III subunit delta [Anaerolineales bacterium]